MRRYKSFFAGWATSWMLNAAYLLYHAARFGYHAALPIANLAVHCVKLACCFVPRALIIPERGGLVALQSIDVIPTGRRSSHRLVLAQNRIWSCIESIADLRSGLLHVEC